MKNFRTVLIRNFVGMIFLVLLAVYLSFNVITNNFISAEAGRELARNVANLEGIAGGEASGAPVIRNAQRPMVVFENIELFAIRMQQMGSLRQLMMNTDGIIINERNEVVPPSVDFINEDTIAQISFLANFYINNRGAFEAEETIRLTGEGRAYYLTAMEFHMVDGQTFSILLYTDISSAISFMHSVNRALGILLVVSGVVGAAVSIIMSSRVQQAVLRLCDYAGVIGQGNFNERVGNFNYKEFNDLSASMNGMSRKLNAYENNQKRFFQNVSHELRTPLMSIQGYAEGIAENVVDKDEAAEIIIAESGRMEGLVNQLLFISRMDGGLDPLRITTFGVRDLLYDCAFRAKMAAEKNGREIIYDFPPGDIQITSDEEKLQRVVGNLLTNGLRHAASAITIGYAAADGGVEITVKDDGAGIGEGDLQFIFERFYKGADGNTGLGLAICKDIMGRLGGAVTGENTPNGARFIVRVPKTERT
jgi:signal transduction histidine kinase